MHQTTRCIESGSLPPQAIMDKDALLLAELDPSEYPVLHFYDWDSPALTYGYFINPSSYLYMERLASHGLQTARRPTGGGIIFHLFDFAFSLLLPASHPRLSFNTLENYALINEQTSRAIFHFTGLSPQPHPKTLNSRCQDSRRRAFCMAQPTCYDLLIDGKKVGGAAQRRTKRGLLHQASLSLFPISSDLLNSVLVNPEGLMEAMHRHSGYLLPPFYSPQEVHHARIGLKEALKLDFAEF